MLAAVAAAAAAVGASAALAGPGVPAKQQQQQQQQQQPNLLWLHVESTDGRLYNEDSPVPIPNIRSVQARGVNFANTYANVPICCPSRASVWTGRQPHNLPHVTNGIDVVGAISNYEGVGEPGSLFDQRKISDLMAAGG